MTRTRTLPTTHAPTAPTIRARSQPAVARHRRILRRPGMVPFQWFVEEVEATPRQLP
jgi:hypothetical protein